MMREVMASTSAACSGVKNASFGEADCADSRACRAAESRAGKCEETHTALRLLHPCDKKLRRLRLLFIVERGDRHRRSCKECMPLANDRSRGNGKSTKCKTCVDRIAGQYGWFAMPCAASVRFADSSQGRIPRTRR